VRSNYPLANTKNDIFEWKVLKPQPQAVKTNHSVLGIMK
jgi:hypothetical protein